jgi:hypothetical protein
VACSEVGDEAAAWSRARIEDGRWHQHGSVLGDRRARALGSFKKLLDMARESTGPEILGHGDLMRDVPLLRVSPISSYGSHT